MIKECNDFRETILNNNVLAKLYFHYFKHVNKINTTDLKLFLDQDKENDARNAQATLATQAAIQRRRRPKRRSTGVVTFDNVDVSYFFTVNLHNNVFVVCFD